MDRNQDGLADIGELAQESNSVKRGLTIQSS
jgi:hypothetical protein